MYVCMYVCMAALHGKSWLSGVRVRVCVTRALLSSAAWERRASRIRAPVLCFWRSPADLIDSIYSLQSSKVACYASWEGGTPM